MRGKVTGTAYAGIGLGNFILFTVFGFMVEAYGWRTTYIMAAILAGTCVVCFSALIKNQILR